MHSSDLHHQRIILNNNPIFTVLLKERLEKCKVKYVEKCKVFKLKEAKTEGIFKERVQARIAVMIEKYGELMEAREIEFYI